MPLNHLRLQIHQSPLSVSIGLKVLRAFLGVLPHSVTIAVLVRPTVSRGRFDALVRRWGADPNRLHLVPAWHPQNLFARDSAQAGVLSGGSTAILLPRPRPRSPEEQNSAEELEAERGLGFPVFRSRLFWEGGNLLFDGHSGLVGANTVAENMIRLEMEESEVMEAVAVELGGSFTALGDVEEARETLAADLDCRHPSRAAEGGQADFHLDLDVALLGAVEGEPTAVVADPEMGLDFLPAILERDDLFQDHYLPPREMRAIFRDDLQWAVSIRKPRLAAYRKSLSEMGYRVRGIPDLRLMDERNHLGRVNTRFNYCNVLPGALEGRASVILFSYGVPDLDDAAFRVYGELGVEPVVLADDGITAGEVLALGGGVHCLASRLA